MRTIRTKVYQFSELSKEAQETAIEMTRQSYYNDNDFAQWAIDDDYLFEPKHDELVKLFGSNFYEEMNKGKKYTDPPMIGNTRKNLYFDTDRNRHIDADDAIEVNNDKYFLLWLGIPEKLIEKVSYTISDNGHRYADTLIEFEVNDYDHEFTESEQTILDDAADKFLNHLADCLKGIESSIEYHFTDDAIIEQIESNEYEFKQDGTRF